MEPHNLEKKFEAKILNGELPVHYLKPSKTGVDNLSITSFVKSLEIIDYQTKDNWVKPSIMKPICKIIE